MGYLCLLALGRQRLLRVGHLQPLNDCHALIDNGGALFVGGAPAGRESILLIVTFDIHSISLVTVLTWPRGLSAKISSLLCSSAV